MHRNLSENMQYIKYKRNDKVNARQRMHVVTAGLGHSHRKQGAKGAGAPN